MRSPYFLPSVFCGVAALVSTPFYSAQALSSAEVSKIAAEITVRIEGQNPGSGVLIRRQGNTYTILTAAHVVETPDEYDIITPDNKIYALDYSNVTKFSGVDLALVEFTSSTTYQVASIGDSDQSPSGTTNYVAGFPAPTQAITEPIFVFSEGKISANVSRALTDGYALVYSNDTLPGMSGGAVLNQDGKLIGIHGRADKQDLVQRTDTIAVKTGFNLGIPINTFRHLVPQVGPRLGFTAVRSKPPSNALTADDWYLRAGEKYNQGDLSGAIADYNKAIQLNPNYASAYNDRGVALQAQGNLQGAITDYNKAIQLDRGNANPYINRGTVRGNLNDYQGAIVDFAQATQLDPQAEQSYYNRAVTYLKINDYPAAIADLNKTIQIKPDWEAAYVGRGLARQSLGDAPGAIADYNRAIQLQPGNVKAYNNRGMVRAELGDQKGAIADYNKAIQLASQLERVYQLERIYFNRGNARQNLEDYQGAMADYNTAIQLKPDDANAYMNRGNARSNLGDRQGALIDYDRAIQIDPNNVDAYFNRAVARKDLEDFRGAIADFDQAIQLDPNDVNAYFSRGVARFKSGNLPGSLADYQKALSIKPNFIPAIINIGLLSYEQGDIQEALAQFQKATQLDQTSAEAQLAQATTLYRLGKMNQARLLATEAIQREPAYQDPEHQRKNLWGNVLIRDAQALLSTL